MVLKYSQNIDRESAYEILSRKVTEFEKAKAEEEARKEWEKGRKGDWETKSASGSRTSRSTRTPQDQMVKVLTSATFIRGVFGILRKVMK